MVLGSVIVQGSEYREHVGCETSSEASNRQLVLSLCRSLSMFVTRRLQKSTACLQPRQCSVTTSSRCTATRFQVQGALVLHFGDIRIECAVPTSSALEFQLSFRRQQRVSIQLFSRFGFPVARLLCCNHMAGQWMCRTCLAPSW